MKIKNFLISILILFYGCKGPNIEYLVSDCYSGPCVVFVYPNKIGIDNKINIDNGLGAIDNYHFNSPFVIRSLESRTPLEEVPIGEENKINDDYRYVFRLVSGSSDNSCVSYDVKSLSFFVGKKTDFLWWIKEYREELSYFESIGIDWCKYYHQVNKGL